MSVHSLIIPQSANVLTVLIQSHRASWSRSHVESHGALLPFVCFMRVYVCMLCIRVCSTFYFFPLFYGCTRNRLCSVTREANRFSQLVSFSLSPPPLLLSTTISLLLGGDGHSWPDIQAGLCLREPHAAGR